MKHKINHGDTLLTFTTVWSEEDREFVGLCDKYPSLSYLDKDEAKARQGVIDLVNIIEAKRGWRKQI